MEESIEVKICNITTIENEWLKASSVNAVKRTNYI